MEAGRTSKNLEILNRYFESLPPHVGAIAYGSGIYPQDEQKKNLIYQLDTMIFLKEEWLFHLKNVFKNSRYYSLTGKVFYLMAPYLYELGSDIAYLPYIDFKSGKEKAVIKSGFIEEGKAIEDLMTWKNGYIAGRFQKDFYVHHVTEKMKKAIAKNRFNALIIGLILLDVDKFPTVEDLIRQICYLSYYGDDTRKIVEDPYKALKVANSQMDRLKGIYQNDSLYDVSENGLVFPNFKEIDNIGLNNLPSNIVNYLKPDKSLSEMNQEELRNFRAAIVKFFGQLNTDSGLGMIVKGLLTAGPVKSYKYVRDKVKKKILSLENAE